MHADDCRVLPLHVVLKAVLIQLHHRIRDVSGQNGELHHAVDMLINIRIIREEPPAGLTNTVRVLSIFDVGNYIRHLPFKLARDLRTAFRILQRAGKCDSAYSLSIGEFLSAQHRFARGLELILCRYVNRKQEVLIIGGADFHYNI